MVRVVGLVPGEDLVRPEVRLPNPSQAILSVHRLGGPPIVMKARVVVTPRANPALTLSKGRCPLQGELGSRLRGPPPVASAEGGPPPCLLESYGRQAEGFGPAFRSVRAGRPQGGNDGCRGKAPPRPYGGFPLPTFARTSFAGMTPVTPLLWRGTLPASRGFWATPRSCQRGARSDHDWR